MRLLMLLFACLIISCGCMPSNKKTSKRVKIAIIDSFYCSKKIYLQKYPSIKIHYPLGESRSTRNCVGEHSSGVHGNLVLENLFYQLEKLDSYEFYLISVFDHRGFQVENLWRRAARFIKENQIPMTVVSASFYKNNNLINLKLNGVVFLAAGTKSLGIKQNTKLYPQINNAENYVLIGASHTSTTSNNYQKVAHPLSLNINIIDYFMETSGNVNDLKGTSYALTEAVTIFLNRCFDNLNLNCLKKISKPIEVLIKDQIVSSKTL